MIKATLISTTELAGVGKHRWECPECRRNGNAECRFNLSFQKDDTIHKCRFCKTPLMLEINFWLEGCFKKEGSDEIICGDNFTAKRVAGLSVDEIYKSYIEFFNNTLRAGETKRI
ncbi:unnamed protein product, partial [marine sediment metagenome]